MKYSGVLNMSTTEEVLTRFIFLQKGVKKKDYKS